MIVKNKGYLKLEDVQALKTPFSIFETAKKTHILVHGLNSTHYTTANFSFPKEDRLPWKLVAGKKITHGRKVFDSTANSLSDLKTDKWNNGNQIMSYEEL